MADWLKYIIRGALIASQLVLFATMWASLLAFSFPATSANYIIQAIGNGRALLNAFTPGYSFIWNYWIIVIGIDLALFLINVVVQGIAWVKDIWS